MTLDTLFPPSVDNRICCFTRALGICHLNKTFHCGTEWIVALVFADALLWLIKKGSRLLASFSNPCGKVSCFSMLRKERSQECSWIVTSYLPHQNAESGISGPRKLLATFKMFRQNKPYVITLIFIQRDSQFSGIKMNQRNLLCHICFWFTVFTVKNSSSLICKQHVYVKLIYYSSFLLLIFH